MVNSNIIDLPLRVSVINDEVFISGQTPAPLVLTFRAAFQTGLLLTDAGMSQAPAYRDKFAL